MQRLAVILANKPRLKLSQQEQKESTEQYISQGSKLLAPVECFAELVYMGTGHLGRETCTLHFFSDQTSQEGIKCTKAKE